MIYFTKGKQSLNGINERLLPRRRRLKGGRAALHRNAVCCSSSKHQIRPARPAAILHVAATCLICLAFTGSTAFAQDNAAPGTRIDADEQTGTIRIVIDGEERAVFDADGLHVDGNITYTGTLTDISDRRLKTDIHRLPPQAENIAALNPVAFSMTGDPAQRTEFGVIAQDMESVYPELVETRAGGAQAVNYTGLIAPLISAVQEVQADNVRLRARIEALEAGADQAPAEAEAR